MSQMDKKHLTYYLVFLVGLGLVGIYMYYAFSVFGINELMDLIYLGSAGAFWLSTLIAVFFKRRSLRLLFTMGSGVIAGSHYLLSTILLGGQLATIMFLILGLGVVMSCSTLIWLRE